MRGNLPAALAVAALMAAVPAMAQQAGGEPPQDGGIVVTGDKQEPIVRARRFVGQVIRQKEARLARFEAPVCVHVGGLGAKYNEAVGERFVAVAEATGVQLAPVGCEPNVLVLFVDDADSFIELARKRYHRVFAQLTSTDLRNALAEGPVRAWRNVVTIDEMGREIRSEMYGFVDRSGYDPANLAAIEAGEAAPLGHRRTTHAATINAVIVMNKALTHGRSVAQIADYAVMRTLAGATPPAKESIASASILSLFDPDVSPVPPEISDMDLGLLGGLYALETPTENVEIEKGRIARAMVSNAKERR